MRVLFVSPYFRPYLGGIERAIEELARELITSPEIESVGVLHHMETPLNGLEVLVDLLKPHGFLKLGLYSEVARKNVVEARKFIKTVDYGFGECRAFCGCLWYLRKFRRKRSVWIVEAMA